MNEVPDPAAQLARRRFWSLQLLRLNGVIIAFVGLLIMVGKNPQAYGLGKGFVAVGLLLALVVPVILARMWKRQRP